MLNILPDVYDWPIAVDNWEAKYGKASFCQRVPGQQAISSFQWLLPSLFFRQTVAAGGRHRQTERKIRLPALDKLFHRHRRQGLQLTYHPCRFWTWAGGRVPILSLGESL